MASALFLVLLSAGIALAAYNEVIPTLDEDGWWATGTAAATKSDTSLKPFTIEWSDEFIADLRYRLNNRRPFPAPLEGIGFQDGFNSDTLNPILDYWADGYDFEARLKILNQYDQYKTNIQGLDIHFLYIKPQINKFKYNKIWQNGQCVGSDSKVNSNVKVLPMMMLHGWPSSFREFLDSIPLLTTPRDGYDFVYELIIPSLPGFGFSDAPVRAGMGVAEVAVIMNKLMQRLGYAQYYVQGGDYGGVVANIMATIYPDIVLGFHTHVPFAIGNLFTARLNAYENLPEVLEEHVRARTYPLSARNAFWDSESGYSHIQRTKPETVGVGLTDSPSGLAAYTLEKFSTGTNIEWRNFTDGGFSQLNIDNLLDNVMIYWTSNSITTSCRYYKEYYGAKTVSYKYNDIPTKVPVWVIQAYNELLVNPAKFMIDKYVNLLNITYSGVGGHYYPLMEPVLFVDDVFRAGKGFQEFYASGGVTCIDFSVDL